MAFLDDALSFLISLISKNPTIQVSIPVGEPAEAIAPSPKKFRMSLKRVAEIESGIFSELRDEQNGLVAVTLEHAYLCEGKNTYSPKIPDGTYTCVKGNHRLEGMTEDFVTFEVTGVIGHTNILFHWGNYNKDSEGCILVGKQMLGSSKEEMITNSRETFAKFMELVGDLDSFELTVS